MIRVQKNVFLPFKAILPLRCLVCKDLGEEMDYPASGSLRLVERRESISQNMKLGRPIKASFSGQGSGAKKDSEVPEIKLPLVKLA